LQPDQSSRLIKAGAKCLSTKNVTSCGGLDSSFSPRVDILDNSKRPSDPVPQTEALPVVQEISSPKLDETAKPEKQLLAKKNIQAFSIKRIEVRESNLLPPKEIKKLSSRESFKDLQVIEPASRKLIADSSMVCIIEESDRDRVEEMPVSGRQLLNEDQVSQSANSQKPRRINTATNFLSKNANHEKRSSTFFASHQDLVKLKNRMASKKDLPQVASATKNSLARSALPHPPSTPNILEHLKGGKAEHSEVRSERIMTSRLRKKNMTAVKLAKLTLKKSSSSRWGKQPIQFEHHSINNSIDSSLDCEDRVQSARLPPSANSSQVLSLDAGPHLESISDPSEETQAANELKECAGLLEGRLIAQRRREVRHLCPRKPNAARVEEVDLFAASPVHQPAEGAHQG
jgi:hypothetical protein